MSICSLSLIHISLIYFTGKNKPSPLTAPNFCMFLRKHLSSARIGSISQPGLERVVEFELEHLNELGDPCKKYLIVELMGKYSNIIFCDENRMILDSIKHVSSHMSSIREVLPGRDYFCLLYTSFSYICEEKLCGNKNCFSSQIIVSNA